MVAGDSAAGRERRIVDFYGRFAGRSLEVDAEVYESERDTGHRNRAIGHMLRAVGWRVDVYERSTEDLASRGAGLGTHDGLVAALRRIGIDLDTSLGVMTQTYIWFASDGTVLDEVPFPRMMTAWSHLYRALRDALHERRLAGVLQVVADHRDEAHAERDGRVPAGVDDAVEVVGRERVEIGDRRVVHGVVVP